MDMRTYVEYHERLWEPRQRSVPQCKAENHKEEIWR